MITRLCLIARQKLRYLKEEPGNDRNPGQAREPIANNVIMNERAFGAGVTDDTQAIQATIDAVAKISGGTYFPAGLYACSTIRCIES